MLLVKCSIPSVWLPPSLQGRSPSALLRHHCTVRHSRKWTHVLYHLPPTQWFRPETWMSSLNAPSHSPPRLIHHQVLALLFSKYFADLSTSFHSRSYHSGTDNCYLSPAFLPSVFHTGARLSLSICTHGMGHGPQHQQCEKHHSTLFLPDHLSLGFWGSFFPGW